MSSLRRREPAAMSVVVPSTRPSHGPGRLAPVVSPVAAPLGGLLEHRLEPLERPRVLPAQVPAGERGLQPLGQADGLELVRERDLRRAGGIGEPVDAARAAPAVFAAATLLDGALGSDALDDRDRDPGM